MAEGPVLELLGRIKDRRNRRLAGWQHDWHDSIEGGQSPGMRGQINPLDSQAISDRAQGVEVSEVAPPRAPQASMDAFQDAGEPAEQDGPGESQSPFRTAGGSGAKQNPVQQAQYTKVCGPNGCQMVPVQPQTQFSVSPQASMGEQIVPGSERVISSRVIPSGGMPQGAVTASTEGVPVLSPMAQRIATLKSLGGFPEKGADQWMLNRAMASEETGAQPGLDIYGRAGLYRDSSFWNRAAIMERQAQRAQEIFNYNRSVADKILAHEQEAGKLQLERERMSTPEGRLSMETRILEDHSLSPQYRAQAIQELNIRSRTDAGVQYSDEQLKAERDMLEGRAVGATVAANVVNTGIVSGSLRPGNKPQASDQNKNHDYGAAALQQVYGRYGNMPAKQLKEIMYRDMEPAIRSRLLAARTGGVMEITPELENLAANEAGLIIDGYHRMVLDWQTSQPQSWYEWAGWESKPSMAPTRAQQPQPQTPASAPQADASASPSRASLIAPQPQAAPGWSWHDALFGWSK
jgi:hypothetical protein